MTPDEINFRAAIAADPDDDLARLAFADWLDERDGSPLAEFIRLQIELDHFAEPDDVLLARREDCRRRESELLSAHRGEWLPPCSSCAGTGVLFTRDVRITIGCAACHSTGRVGVARRGFAYSTSCVTDDAFVRVEPAHLLDRPSYLDTPSDWLVATLRDFPLIERVRLVDQQPYYSDVIKGERPAYEWWDERDPDRDEGTGYPPLFLFKCMWADWKPQRNGSHYNDADNVRWLRFANEAEAIDALGEAVVKVGRRAGAAR